MEKDPPKQDEISRRRFLKGGIAATIGAIFKSNVGQAEQETQPEQVPPAAMNKLILVGGSIAPGYDWRDLPVDEQAARKIFDPDGILKEVAERSGLKDKTVVVVTSASGLAADKAESAKKVFRFLGAAKVVTISSRDEALQKEKTGAISDPNTALLWFTGGDQVDLVNRFKGTPAYRAMRDRFFNRDDGFTVGGTSAGAAAMSMRIIFEDRRAISGLGMTSIAVDTHVDGKHLGKRDKKTGEYTANLQNPFRLVNRIKESQAYGASYVGLALEEGVGVEIPRDGDVANVFGRKDDEWDKTRTKQATFLKVEGKTSKPFEVKVGESIELSKLGLGPVVQKAGVVR